MRLKWVKGHRNELAAVEEGGVIDLARVLIEMDYLQYSMAWEGVMHQYVVLLGKGKEREVICVYDSLTLVTRIMNKVITEGD